MKIFNKLFNNKKTEKSDSLIIEEKDYQEIVNTVTKASNIMKKPTKMKKSSTIEKSRKKQLKNQYKESVARRNMMTEDLMKMESTYHIVIKRVRLYLTQVMILQDMM